MTEAVLPRAARRFSSPVETLRDNHAALTSFGLAFLMLAGVTASLSFIDGRTLGPVSVWAKPAKFFLSTGVFLLTSAWLFGLVRPERRGATRLVVSTRVLIAATCFELGYITFQAARGEPSHFNRSDLLHVALYGAMGFAALVMLAAKIPLAIEIAKRPAPNVPSELRLASVLGVGLTVALGALTGFYMGQNFGSGHDVGAVGGAAPMFGWNRLGGDLRVAHFFGMHAEQILPIVAALGLATPGRPWTRRLVLAAATGVVILTVFTFVQAVAGRPFPFG